MSAGRSSEAVSRKGTRRKIGALAIALFWTAAAIVPHSAEASPLAFLASKGTAEPPSGARALCREFGWACARSAQVRPMSGRQMAKVAAVNAGINRATRSVDDKRQYGVAEHWALPTEKGGDCEDFALLKKRELIRLGIEPQRLLVATVLDRDRNPHAVLVLRTDDGDVVLDNLTDQIKPWQETRYIFLRMQDPDRPSSWMHVFLGG